jgi:hypothetical protein
MATYNTPDELRQAGARCREMAKSAKAPEVRATLYGLATTYYDLARQVESLTKSDHWPPPNSN